MLQYVLLNSGRRVSIDYDTCAENPRDLGSDIKLYCLKNRNFSLDENLSKDDLSKEYSLAKTRGDYVLPLYAFMHGCVLISTSAFPCSWDSSVCGFAAVPKNVAENEEEALKFVEAELEILNAYFSGNVYKMSVESLLGFDGWEVDSAVSDLYLFTVEDIKAGLEALELTKDELEAALEAFSAML